MLLVFIDQVCIKKSNKKINYLRQDPLFVVISQRKKV